MERRILPLSIAVLIATACAQDLSVHVRGGDRPPDPGYLVLSSGVDVDQFRIVMRNLRLQSQPTDGGVQDTPGARIIGPGPYLVDLPAAALTGGAFTEVFSGYSIGAKGFYEMDIDLAPVSDADVQAVPALAPLLGKTFVISGHYPQGGVPFTFESSTKQVLVRESVFRMGMNHNNLDVNIAPNTWFVNPDGGVIDPNTTDPALRATIEANVAASIDAYEDDNMDGVPDPLG
ncbi:MAG: hypothetical protein ACXWLR_13470 [Myxococcales bacterium]